MAIADSELVSHSGLKHAIERFEDVGDVLSAYSKEDLYSIIDSAQPQLLVVDPYLSDLVTLSDLKEIRNKQRELKILLISSSIKSFNLYQAITRGFKVYLSKSCTTTELEGAVKAAMKGERFFCRKTVDVFLEVNNGDSGGYVISRLTEREIEVLELMIKGIQTEEIADRLHISYHTIVAHRKSILRKFKVNGSVELILKSLEIGLL